MISSNGKILNLVTKSMTIHTICLVFLSKKNFQINNLKYQKYTNIFGLYYGIIIVEIKCKDPNKLV